VRSLAVISFHTSPLAQPGAGDGGGMNVYVRQLAAGLARSGTSVDVYTRADSPALAAVVDVEPGLRVHHIAAGPLAPVAKQHLPELVPEFVDGVSARLAGEHPADAIHANYWLSGIAGHELKHRFELPLGCTFHTLARVKGLDTGDAADRADHEAAVIGCSDAVLASCGEEADQLIQLYGADPDRVSIVAPGVDHAFFGPGSPIGARRAVGLAPDRPVVLYVGRIQPLKGLDVAIDAFARLERSPQLVVVGGPSGPAGSAYRDRVVDQATGLGVADRVRWVPPQPHEMLASWYRAADVVLVPSQSESFGLVALEAAACGVPVVATAVGGLRTLVIDGRTGYLRERRPEAFADAAAPILEDRRLASSLGSAAVTHARAFTWGTAARNLARLFRDLTDRVPVACS
jgi:D-inositol-3-phosphate glycosyltransferase